MSKLDLSEEHARELKSLPADWHAYRWEVFPKGGYAAIYYQVTGMACPLKMTGKSRGRPNFKKADPTTKRVVVLTVDAHNAWLIEWERKTGKCWRCQGDGKVIESFGVKTGPTYRKCQRCAGSGKGRG